MKSFRLLLAALIVSVFSLASAPVASAAARFDPAAPATVKFEITEKVSDEAFVSAIKEAALERGWVIEKSEPLASIKKPKTDSKATKEGSFQLTYKGNSVTLTYDDLRHVTLLQTGGTVDTSRWLRNLQVEIQKSVLRRVK